MVLTQVDLTGQGQIELARNDEVGISLNVEISVNSRHWQVRFQIRDTCIPEITVLTFYTLDRAVEAFNSLCQD